MLIPQGVTHGRTVWVGRSFGRGGQHLLLPLLLIGGQLSVMVLHRRDGAVLPELVTGRSKLTGELEVRHWNWRPTLLLKVPFFRVAGFCRVGIIRGPVVGLAGLASVARRKPPQRGPRAGGGARTARTMTERREVMFLVTVVTRFAVRATGFRGVAAAALPAV
jgi:hypothetical protein